MVVLPQLKVTEATRPLGHCIEESNAISLQDESAFFLERIVTASFIQNKVR